MIHEVALNRDPLVLWQQHRTPLFFIWPPHFKRGSSLHGRGRVVKLGGVACSVLTSRSQRRSLVALPCPSSPSSDFSEIATRTSDADESIASAGVGSGT